MSSYDDDKVLTLTEEYDAKKKSNERDMTSTPKPKENVTES
jgi:hypothetical protein